MLRVTESKAEGACVGRRSRKRFLIVTNSARRQVTTSLRFTARRMAGVTLVVRGDAGGNRERAGSVAHSSVTGRAAIPGPRRRAHVLRVIELDVETVFEFRRKAF